jgi:hypothetical protein
MAPIMNAVTDDGLLSIEKKGFAVKLTVKRPLERLREITHTWST